MIQASFFWKNNQLGGIGLTFGPPSFTPTELKMMFEGDVVKRFMRDSDAARGTDIVHTMLAQLTSIGHAHRLGDVIQPKHLLLAALNIIWLSSRGFIPNDEFNGPQFINTLPAAQPKKGDQHEPALPHDLVPDPFPDLVPVGAGQTTPFSGTQVMNIDNMSREERVALALVDYINATPDHHNGLCFYLDEVLDEGLSEYRWNGGLFCDSYNLVKTARKVLPEFERDPYVTYMRGPTPRRLEFAAALLKMLETGRVYHCPHEGWVLR